MVSEIFLANGTNRTKAMDQLLEQFKLKQFKGKQIALKANYNSADPFPAQTHSDTLKQLVSGLLIMVIIWKSMRRE